MANFNRKKEPTATDKHADVAKLKCAPGEVLLVTVRSHHTSVPLTIEMAARIRDAFKRAFDEGGGHVPTILVVDDKIEVRIACAEAVESVAAR